MTQSTTQRRASLFAAGGTRGVNLVGKPYGVFVVESHVGGRDDAIYVNIRCTKCDALTPVRRDQLSQKALYSRCGKCPVEMTEEQRRVIMAVGCANVFGVNPTVSDLQSALGHPNFNTTASALKRLERLGAVTMVSEKPKRYRVGKPPHAEVL